MPIKDKSYWKEYNQKRKEKGYFQQNYQTRKEQVVKIGEGVVKSPPVVKNESLQPKKVLQPILQPEISLQPLPCSRCQTLENSISNFANLTTQEQEKVKKLQQTIREQNKVLVEKNQTEEKLLKEISDYKEKISKLAAEKQKPIQIITNLQKPSQNSNNSLSIPNLYQLITKHKKIQSSQHKYSERDVKERQFLKGLLNELWELN